MGIEVSNLADYVEQADPILRAMVGEIWDEAGDQRDHRAISLGARPMDPGTERGCGA